jgi:4-oxalocrotonate tautomerase
VRVLVDEVAAELWGRGGKTVADRIVEGSASQPNA